MAFGWDYNMAIYGKVGTSDAHEDITENPTCPKGMILMQAAYPSGEGIYIAQADGTWTKHVLTKKKLQQLKPSLFRRLIDAVKIIKGDQIPWC